MVSRSKHGRAPFDAPMNVADALGERFRAAVLQAAWTPPPGVNALTTLRRPFGVSEPPFDSFNLGDRCGDDPDRVASNRNALGRGLGLRALPRWLRQVHGVDVVRCLKLPDPRSREADAAVTSEPGVVLAVLTADCLPVVLSARDGSEIAVAHAGWRGLAGGVLESTIHSMQTQASDLVAWLGPAAGPDQYEIGIEVHRAFVDGDAAAADVFVPTRANHWKVDLFALARRRLALAGVSAVSGGGVCTISDGERFFSHRRDGDTGRMATLAWIAPVE